MKKLNCKIIHDTKYNKVYIAIDDGEYTCYQKGSKVLNNRLLHILSTKDRYDINVVRIED